MEQDTTAIAKMAPDQFSLAPANLDQAMKFGDFIAKSSFCPVAFQKGTPEKNAADVALAVQMGHEVGLQPLQSLQSIAVVNGIPSLWGAGALGLIQSSPVCEYIIREFDTQNNTAVVRCKRVGDPVETVHTYSWEDAVKAKLDKKETYIKHPKDMLTWKAVARAGKFTFPDVMKGLGVREDTTDYPEPDTTAERLGSLNERLQADQEKRAKSEAKPNPQPEADISDATVIESEKATPTSDGTVVPDGEKAPAGVVAPAGTDASASDISVSVDGLVALFNTYKLPSPTGMDRVCQLVLKSTFASVQNLKDDELHRVAASLKCMSEFLGENLPQFVSFCSAQGLVLDSPLAVSAASEQYQQSLATTDDSE